MGKSWIMPVDWSESRGSKRSERIESSRSFRVWEFHPLVWKEHRWRAAKPAPMKTKTANNRRCSSPSSVVTASIKMLLVNRSRPLTALHILHLQPRTSATCVLPKAFRTTVGGKRRFLSRSSRRSPFFFTATWISSSRRVSEKHGRFDCLRAILIKNDSSDFVAGEVIPVGLPGNGRP